LTFPPPGTGSERPEDDVDEPLDDGRGVREPLDGVRLRGVVAATVVCVGCTGIRLDTVVPGLVAVAELILIASIYAEIKKHKQFYAYIWQSK